MPHVEYAPVVHLQLKFSSPDTRLVVPVFQKGDDHIDATNDMMSFLTSVVTSRYPATNNQLRTSSNPRQQATINNRRVTIQPIHGRQNSMTAGLSRPYTSGSSGTSGKQRVIVFYNCKGEAQVNGHVLQEEELEFLADPGITETSSTQNQSAQTVHMLTKPQFFYDHSARQALGFQNTCYLKRAQQLKPKLYGGSVIEKSDAIVIHDSEEMLMLAEESRSKMIQKQNEPIMSVMKVNTKPVDYAALN
nr:hypothetical protein [Tanacetum cinerariifolium]